MLSLLHNASQAIALSLTIKVLTQSFKVTTALAQWSNLDTRGYNVKILLKFRYRLFKSLTVCKMNWVCDQQGVLIKRHYVCYDICVSEKRYRKNDRLFPSLYFSYLNRLTSQQRTHAGIEAGIGTLYYDILWVKENGNWTTAVTSLFT